MATDVGTGRSHLAGRGQRQLSAALLARVFALAGMAPSMAMANAGGAVPSLTGAAGLYRISSADVGVTHDLRLALHAEFVRATNLLVLGGVDTRVGGTLSLGFTLHRRVELFGALHGSSNWERQETPGQTASFNDTGAGLIAGSKLVTGAWRGLAGGGELGARLPLNQPTLSAGSIWIAAVGSLDLAALSPVPIRLHANVGYYDDNSRAEVDFTGLPIATRQRVMFARGMGASRFRVGVGIDAPLEDLTGRFRLRPFGEYHWEYVTAEADPAFRDLIGGNHNQQWLTFGVRSLVHPRVTLDLGVDLNIRSVGFPFGPPLPPYNVVAGVSVRSRP